MFLGLGLVGASAATFLASVMARSVPPGEALASIASMALAGVGAFAIGALPLPRWAKLRKQQMDELAERLIASLAVRQIPPAPGSDQV
jgi:hypothetical protein